MAIKDQRKTIFDSTKKYKDQQNIEEILNNHASDPVHVNNVFFMNTEQMPIKIKNDMFDLKITQAENKSNDSYFTAENKSDEGQRKDSYEELDKAYNNTIKIQTLP